MALTDLKKSFTARAAAIGLGAMAAFTPLSSAYADSASKPPVMAASNTQSVLTQEERARVDVLDLAREYARNNPGHIGVSVLRGPDAEDWTGIQIAKLFASKLEERQRVPALLVSERDVVLPVQNHGAHGADLLKRFYRWCG